VPRGRCAALLLLLLPCVAGLSREVAQTVRAGNFVAPDQSSRAAALAAVDTAGPWCTLSDGALLDVAVLPASFGCAAAGEERCVRLGAVHLDQCVYVPARQHTGPYLNQLPEWRLGRLWLVLGAKLGYVARRSGEATLAERGLPARPRGRTCYMDRSGRRGGYRTVESSACRCVLFTCV